MVGGSFHVSLGRPIASFTTISLTVALIVPLTACDQSKPVENVKSPPVRNVVPVEQLSGTLTAHTTEGFQKAVGAALRKSEELEIPVYPEPIGFTEREAEWLVRFRKREVVVKKEGRDVLQGVDPAEVTFSVSKATSDAAFIPSR